MLTRSFTAADVESVADLFQRAQTGTRGPAPQALQNWIRRRYLGRSGYSGSPHSLICETAGRVSGFLGAVPLAMRFRGRPIDAVLCGPLVIRPDLTHPFVSSRLLRDFCDSPKDLTIVESRDETVRRFWQSNGSMNLPQFSLPWLQVLRPGEFAASIAAKLRRKSDRATSVPLDRLTSQFAGRRPRIPFARDSSTLRSVQLTAPLLRRAVLQMATEFALLPDHDLEQIERLLETAHAARHPGRLVATALYDGWQLAGCYVYRSNPGKMAHVLDVMARPGSRRAVLEHLFDDAWQRGGLAVTGRTHPALMADLSELDSVFLNDPACVQVHSSNRDLLHAMHNGNALLPGLAKESMLPPAAAFSNEPSVRIAIPA